MCCTSRVSCCCRLRNRLCTGTRIRPCLNHKRAPAVSTDPGVNNAPTQAYCSLGVCMCSCYYMMLMGRGSTEGGASTACGYAVAAICAAAVCVAAVVPVEHLWWRHSQLQPLTPQTLNHNSKLHLTTSLTGSSSNRQQQQQPWTEDRHGQASSRSPCQTTPNAAPATVTASSLPDYSNAGGGGSMILSKVSPQQSHFSLPLQDLPPFHKV